jgi:hypothetical protein
MGNGSRAAANAAAAGTKASSGTRTPLTNAQFATHAVAAARSVPASERIFANKVLIADAHAAFARTAEGKGVTLSAFKRRLAEAHFSTYSHARGWSLSRFDQVEAARTPGARAKVAASETRARGAEFHFITFDR